jgi:hypothetical protein
LSKPCHTGLAQGVLRHVHIGPQHDQLCSSIRNLFTGSGFPLAGCEKSASRLCLILFHTLVKDNDVVTFCGLPSSSSSYTTSIAKDATLPFRVALTVPRAESEPWSSLNLSQRQYRLMISCAMVAISGIDTFNPASQPTVSSCFSFPFPLGGAPFEDCVACREERRGADVLDADVLEELVTAREADCAWMLFRVDGWSMQVRYIAAIAMRCGGYIRHRSDRYVSLIINL